MVPGRVPPGQGPSRRTPVPASHGVRIPPAGTRWSGERFAGVDDEDNIITSAAAADQRPKYCYDVCSPYAVTRPAGIAADRSNGGYADVFVIQKLKKQLLINFFF